MKESLTQDEEAPPPLFSSAKREQALQTDLAGVTIVAGDFRKHSYSFMNITDCDLSFSNFRQANLISALISCSDLSGVNLTDANLEYSELEHTSLAHAQLCRANLQGSKFESVDFNGSDLRGADLTGCILHRCTFKDALFDRQTLLPFSLARARQLGMILHRPIFSDAAS